MGNSQCGARVEWEIVSVSRGGVGHSGAAVSVSRGGVEQWAGLGAR